MAPSTAYQGTVPGADWLAGLPRYDLLPRVPRGSVILTTLCHGSGNSMRMCWPLWAPSLTPDEISTTLALPNLAALPAFERTARGISLILESTIDRSDQGYGSFALPSMVKPA